MRGLRLPRCTDCVVFFGFWLGLLPEAMLDTGRVTVTNGEAETESRTRGLTVFPHFFPLGFWTVQRIHQHSSWLWFWKISSSQGSLPSSEVSFYATWSEHAAVWTTNTGRPRVEVPSWAHPCLLQQFIDLQELQDPILSKPVERLLWPVHCTSRTSKVEMQLSGVRGIHFSLSWPCGQGLEGAKLPGPQMFPIRIRVFFLFCCSSFLFLSLLISSNLAEI